jgi:hypothetical protein
MSSIIKFCPDCISHSVQDKKYGQNYRVMNTKAGDKGKKCTVCGTVHTGSSLSKKKK